MVSHRLARLARLTQGVALLGIGVVQAGCDKPATNPDTLHVNGPAPTVDPASLDASPAPDTTSVDAGAPLVFDGGAHRRGPHVNATPGQNVPHVNSPPSSSSTP